MKQLTIPTLCFALFMGCTEIEHPFGCHMQSPVNIMTSSVEGGVSHQVVLHYGTSKERVANTGHSVQVNYDSGSYLTFDNNRYEFRQFHFHTPSEHTLDSDQLMLEMHMVHTMKVEGQEDPNFLVVAVFFEEGESNAFLDSFLDAVPQEAETERVIENRRIDATSMIPEELHEYYHYKGSLTTPPYTETVDWVVLKEIKKASKKQIEQIRSIEGDNAREVQALYDRSIESVQ